MTMRGREVGWSVGEQDTIVAALRRAVAAKPSEIWLDFQGDTYSYAEMDRLSTRLGNSLAALGVKMGDTVVTFLDNSPDAVICLLAITRLGAIYVPINTGYKGEFLRHQVSNSGAQILIAESDYAERVAEIAGSLTDLKLLLYRGKRPDLKGAALAIVPLDEHRGTDDTPINVAMRPRDLACLIYTSGTTGPAKGCMLSHNFVCNLARQNNEIFAITPDDIFWTCLPLFHFNAVAISIVASLLAQAKVAVVPRFSVTNFWPDIVRSRASIASVLGTMATLVAKAPDTEASRAAHGQIRAMQGAPWPPDVAATWKRRFGIQTEVVARLFGITEACVVTQVSIHEKVPPGSSGKRSDYFDVRIVDDDDNELPPGVAGEVMCRPLKPHIMFEGYWRRPEATQAIMRNMWLHMGDIGKFDEDGFFYFVDRKKDYLRRRGENISSFEMEAAFGAHPDIQEVAVHAVLSELAEDDIKVTAVLRQGASLTEEELCRWCVDKVPYFAVPRYIEFRTELPKNPVGRVLKYQLRDEGKTPNTWDFEHANLIVKRR
jgi:crotonobetaine/carnitine-CoA ligase